ncbi:hypothetical protein ABPG74_020135 [Tetrahymena malaccensis]
MQEKAVKNLQLQAEKCLELNEWQAERLLKNKKTQDVFLNISHCYAEDSLVQRKACILQAVFKRLCKDQGQEMLNCVKTYQKVPQNQLPQNVCEKELLTFMSCAERLTLIPLANQEVI